MIPRFTLKPGQVVVDSLTPAFRWFADGLNTVSDPPPRDVVPLLIERRVYTSGASYGIGASEVGDSFIERGAAEFIGTHSDSDPTPRVLRFVSKWGIEINRGCQAEACNARGGPEHLFNDMCDFLPHIWRKRCGLDGHAASKWPHVDLKKHLPYIKVKLKARCIKCCKDCEIQRTHLHRAGSPCIHHNKIRKRQEEHGEAS